MNPLLFIVPILVFLAAYRLVRGPRTRSDGTPGRAGAPARPSRSGAPGRPAAGARGRLAASARSLTAGVTALGRGLRSLSGGPARTKLPLGVAAVAAVVSIGVLRLLGVGSGEAGESHGHADDHQASAGSGCIGLSMVASPDKDDLMAQLAAEYEKTRPAVEGRCVDVTVTTKTSGAAAEALARGWDEQADGPRPDVWSPAATSWVTIVRQRLAERDTPSFLPDKAAPIATSPLVFAMPRPMAEAMGWPDKPIGWSDVLSLARDPAGWARLGHPEWGPFRLGKTDANLSTSGLHATIGAYFAATGRSSDLSDADLDNAEVKSFVRGVEASVVHYGDNTLTFLENLRKADDRGAGLTYVSAVTVEEKSVWDYNQGIPSGDPAGIGKRPPPKTPLVAVYPKDGTLFHDHPYVVLRAAWVTDDKQKAAQSFFDFLISAKIQRRFQSLAFRDSRGRPGEIVKVSEGMLASEPKVVLAKPGPALLDRIQRSWNEMRKRARILLVIDVSGSMAQPVPNAGASKIELVKDAVSKALDRFPPDDEMGLWIFSSSLGSGKPYLELAPIAPVGQHLGELRQKIASLAPQGGTALYATTRAAVRTMRQTLDSDRINAVVVLTDGHNEYPADTDLDGLLEELPSEGNDQAIRVFTIAYGEDADVATLQKLAEVSGGVAYNAADPVVISKILSDLISNF